MPVALAKAGGFSTPFLRETAHPSPRLERALPRPMPKRPRRRLARQPNLARRVSIITNMPTLAAAPQMRAFGDYFAKHAAHPSPLPFSRLTRARTGHRPSKAKRIARRFIQLFHASSKLGQMTHWEGFARFLRPNKCGRKLCVCAQGGKGDRKSPLWPGVCRNESERKGEKDNGG